MLTKIPPDTVIGHSVYMYGNGIGTHVDVPVPMTYKILKSSYFV